MHISKVTFKININRRKFRSQTSDVWTDAAAVVRRVREEKESEEKESEKRESKERESEQRESEKRESEQRESVERRSKRARR
jgi:alpha 1,2-mannosyltransferase